MPLVDPADLLADWLGEVLFLFEVGHLLPFGFSVTRRDGGIRGEPFDPARHEPSHEIKAVTRHLLDVRHAGDGWIATVVVDV